MSYKTILVQGGTDAAAERRVLQAAAIAQQSGGAVLGVGAEALVLPMVADFAFSDPGIYQQLRDDAKARLADAHSRFEHACGTTEHAWVAAIDYPNQVMALHARGADLIIANSSTSSDPEKLASPADLVMESGLPVLLCPDTGASFSGLNIVVAWKDTRESRRALSDALPFLKRAKAVILLHATESGDTSNTQPALSAVQQRLKRHGVMTETEKVEPGSRTICQSLIESADRHGADLIVAGAYGHSRLREWVFGGVTQDLIEGTAKKFILFSH